MTQAAEVLTPTHVVELGGEVRYVNADSYQAVCDELVSKHGGVPKVSSLVAEADPMEVDRVILEEVKKTEPENVEVGAMDADGRDRSAVDDSAARAAGFSPAQPVFERGSRAVGMDRHKQEFELLPETEAAMGQLVKAVVREERVDVLVEADSIRMTAKGTLLAGSSKYVLDRRAVGPLAYRLDMPGGAGTYLSQVWPELRAVNVNRWTDRMRSDHESRLAEHEARNGNVMGVREQAPERKIVTLRTRSAAGGENPREVFAVVSPSYTPFDVDKIAEAIAIAAPEGSRCEVAYDGHGMKTDVVFFSNVEPKHAVAGEFFKAGVRVKTDDTGGGSVVVQALVWQNLCLNFMIIDVASQEVVRLRHLGSVEKLAAAFKQGFEGAFGKLAHFLKAWDYAQEENVVVATARSLELEGEDELTVADLLRMPVSQALPGIFNGIMERDLVPVPRRDRKATAGKLLEMWAEDDSAARRDPNVLTRAGVVNAFTRYAHKVEADPFKAAEIEQAASTLLFGRRGRAPAPLPYLSLEA